MSLIEPALDLLGPNRFGEVMELMEDIDGCFFNFLLAYMTQLA